MDIATTHLLDEALKRAGFPLPANCRNVRITMGIDEALMITYEVFLTLDNLLALSQAFKEMGEEGRESALGGSDGQ